MMLLLCAIALWLGILAWALWRASVREGWHG
jgi:hypothetical protein